MPGRPPVLPEPLLSTVVSLVLDDGSKVHVSDDITAMFPVERYTVVSLAVVTVSRLPAPCTGSCKPTCSRCSSTMPLSSVASTSVEGLAPARYSSGSGSTMAAATTAVVGDGRRLQWRDLAPDAAAKQQPYINTHLQDNKTTMTAMTRLGPGRASSVGSAQRPWRVTTMSSGRRWKCRQLVVPSDDTLSRMLILCPSFSTFCPIYCLLSAVSFFLSLLGQRSGSSLCHSGHV